MRLIDRLRATDVSARSAAICIGALLVLATAATIAARNAASRPAKSAVAAKAKASSEKPRAVEPKPRRDDAPARPADGDRYAIIVRRDLFRPFAAGGSPAPAAGEAKPASPLPPGGKLPVLPPAPGTPSPPPPGGQSEVKKTIAFTGVVESPAGTQALIENLSTKETRFVAVGETAFGCRLVSISQQMVSIEKDGSQFTLALGENKPDTEPAAAQPPKPGPEQKPPQPEPGRPGPKP